MDPLAALLESDNDIPLTGKDSKSSKAKKGVFEGLEEDEDIFDVISKKKDKGKKKKSIFDSDSEVEDFVKEENPSKVKANTDSDTLSSGKKKTLDFSKLSIKEKKATQKNKTTTKESKDKKINVISGESSNALNSILVTEVKTNNTDFFMNDTNIKRTKKNLESDLFEDSKNSDDTNFFAPKTKTSTNVANIRIRSQENEAEADKKDTEFGDLMVGKILERENEANFFDFTLQQKKEVPKQKAQVTTIITESTRTVVKEVKNVPLSNEEERQNPLDS